jgi:TRAP-type C4-dicarboxylate transport system substrate-binding protein
MVRNILLRGALLSGFAWPLFASAYALASEVKVVTTTPTDIFPLSLQHSPALEATDTKVVVEASSNEDDVLNAVLNGSADVGLFSLSVLSNRKFDEQPTLFSVFTRPFVFNSSEQIYRLEDTPLGDAALADVARIGVSPLGYWNRGLTQILAKQPLTSPKDFQGITIGANWTATLKDSGARPILMDLGANPKPTANLIAEFASGAIGGTIWEPLNGGKSNLLEFQHLPFQTFATKFQPIVGVVAASTAYWNSLSTAQKTAWDEAIKEANNRSLIEIRESDFLNSKYSKTVALNREQIQLVSNALPDKEQFAKDYKLLSEAKMFVSSQQDARVKKKAN